MPRSSDHLLHLSGYRLTLRSANFISPEAVLAATPEQRASTRHCDAEIRQLVVAGHPDVIRALFITELDWQAAILSSEPGARLLSVSRGTPGHTESLLLLTYRVDDGGRGEREPWRALVGVLGKP